MFSATNQHSKVICKIYALTGVLCFTSTRRQVQQTCPLLLICHHPSQPSFASYRSGSTGTGHLTSDTTLCSCDVSCLVRSTDKYTCRELSGLFVLSRATESQKYHRQLCSYMVFLIHPMADGLGINVFMLSMYASSQEMSWHIGQCQKHTNVNPERLFYF